MLEVVVDMHLSVKNYYTFEMRCTVLTRFKRERYIL